MYIFHLQHLHRLLAQVIILRRLLHISHDIELGVRHFLLYQKESSEKCHHILDRHHPHHCPDAESSLMLLHLRNILEALQMNTVGHNADFVRGAAQILLHLTIMLKESVYLMGGGIRKLGQIIEVLNPDGLKIPLYPITLYNLSFSLPGINAMLRYYKGLVMNLCGQSPNYPAVSRGHTVIHIRLGQILLQQIEKRQQHGAQCPKELCEGQVTVLFFINPLNDIEKIAGHKDAQGTFESLAITENRC